MSYRRRTDCLVRQISSCLLPTDFGDFEAIAYKSDVDETPYLILKVGTWKADEPVLVRVHSGCMTGDIF
ncbi:MAG: bifunctional 3,4-dihydroxy-2-butanone-4-phosphate synthase/GTP cyclohydrolase II, partial [SAR324 cluster bacterium]|nr:bifunctional 3,4-dihydroxy-2-butanone-4-phosphate synthase/GTP cyclohydrolase II [SAR324 cluster bacterium]